MPKRNGHRDFTWTIRTEWLDAIANCAGKPKRGYLRQGHKEGTEMNSYIRNMNFRNMCATSARRTGTAT